MEKVAPGKISRRAVPSYVGNCGYDGKRVNCTGLGGVLIFRVDEVEDWHEEMEKTAEENCFVRMSETSILQF